MFMRIHGGCLTRRFSEVRGGYPSSGRRREVPGLSELTRSRAAMRAMRSTFKNNVTLIARNAARDPEGPAAGRKRDALPAPRDNLAPPQGEHLDNP